MSLRGTGAPGSFRTRIGYGGYVLRDGKHSLYHAGDTAYFSGFREIGRRLGPEVALLPIGAYNPPSFRNVHAVLPMPPALLWI